MRHRTQEEKEEILRNIENAIKAGKTAKDAMKDEGIMSPTFYKWRKKYENSTNHYTKTRSRIDWRNIIESCKASGLSVANYCVQNGIHYTAYMAAQNRLRKRDLIEPAREIVVEKNGSDVDRMNQLKAENQRLRIIVSDLMLDRQALLEFSGRV